MGNFPIGDKRYYKTRSLLKKRRENIKASKSITRDGIVQLSNANKNITTNGGSERFRTQGAFQITMHAKSANVRNTRGEQ